MSRRLHLPLLLLLSSIPLSAAYTYYRDYNPLSSINATDWWQNGTISAGANGVTSSATNGGSLISKVTAPAPSASYEIRTQLRLLSSGGTYIHYLRASSDAMSGPVSQGTYYSIELQNVSINAGSCSATLAIYRRQSNVVTLLASYAVGCYDEMNLTTLVRPDGLIVVRFDSVYVTEVVDTGIASGQPGVGVIGAPSSNTIKRVRFGPLDSTAPDPISSGSAGTTALPNSVEMQWEQPADNVNGKGIWHYWVFRNGGWIASVNEPFFVDATVSPNTTYSYDLYAMDLHRNVAAPYNFSVTTPSTGTKDPRHIGIRATSAYWGAGGENIDMRSGNLNFSLPLLAAQKRAGGGAAFGLSYNSQLWRQDSAGTWKYGRDVGYGYGWKLMMGSINAIWQNYYLIHHYLYTDSTGAEYPLTVNTGNVWTSPEVPGLAYDANTLRLYFIDGTFWYMGCLSDGAEADAGTRYPMVVQDTNGNQVLIGYKYGKGALWPDTSARIDDIEDVRAKLIYLGGPWGYRTYLFNYNTDATPHLISIDTQINDGQSYTFSYSADVTLKSPFNAALTFGTTKYLTTVTKVGTNLTHTMTYGTNDAGELTKVQFPLGGDVQWTYRTFTYSGSRSYREVQNRKLTMKYGGPTITYPILHDDTYDANNNTHFWTVLDDAGGIGRKQWYFEINPASAYFGRPVHFDEIELPSTFKRRSQYAYATTPGGVKYVFSELTTLDVGAAYQKQSKVEQDVNDLGLVTQRRVFDFGIGSTPSSTATSIYRTTYVTDSNYTSRYMRGLVLWKDMQLAGGPWRDIVQNTYDNYSGANSLVNRTGLREHDSANYGTGVTYRGNVTSAQTPAGAFTTRYDIAGMVDTASQGGTSVQVAPDSTKNYAVPYQVTPNGNSSLTSTMSWNSFLGLTQETGPNGATSTFGYDTWGRNTGVSSPHGSSTTTTFPSAGTYPAYTTTTVSNGGAGGNGRWTKTTVDGFGRATKVETGYSTTTVSTVETEYEACACSPLGKVKRVSRPYAPGGTVYWTTYTYDALGRTLAVTLPSTNGTSPAGITTYLYEGNMVKTTDAAGKWKKFTMNALGQLTKVIEPNPAGGTDYDTTYTYDIWGNLTGVSMPRGGTTQTRSFTYNSTGQMTQSILPENGTTNYSFYTDGRISWKTDAKNQKVAYVYDTYKRLTEVRRYTVASDPNSEDLKQRVTHYYDTNPFDATFTQNGAGRRVATVYWIRRALLSPPNPLNGQIIEMYSYTTGGLINKKRVTAFLQNPVGGPDVVNFTEVQYTYDTEGRRTQMVYPKGRYRNTGAQGAPWEQDASRTLNYTYDSMGRANTMAEPSPGSTWISGVTYNAAGQPTNVGSTTYTYNVLGQLTQKTVGSLFSERYDYSHTANNGRITGKKNLLSGEEVLYAYDSLQRLASATTVGPEYGQSFTYDGWGNLIGATLTKGTGPSNLNITVNGLTNRVNGQTYDANGNAGAATSYDIDNRLIVGGSYLYGYDGGNKRVTKSAPINYDEDGNVYGEELLMFYGAGGERLAEFTMSIVKFGVPTQHYLRFTEKKTLVWFGSKLLRDGKYNVVQDRLGSVRYRYDITTGTSSTADYYPYGQEKPSATTHDREKFATYIRDAETGLDYADQRYYSPGNGKFLTPDPYQASAGPGSPGSWNRYAYVEGDPANYRDPKGLQSEGPDYDPYSGLIDLIKGRLDLAYQQELGQPRDEDLRTDLQKNLARTNAEARMNAAAGFQRMKTECQDFLKSKKVSGNGGNLWNKALGDIHRTNFIDLSDPLQAYSQVGDVWQAGEWDDIHGGSYEAMIDWVARNAKGKDFTGWWDGKMTVYLGEDYQSRMDYSNNLLDIQKTLVHEMLHASIGGNHIVVATALGLFAGFPGQNETLQDNQALGSITKWLDDCIQ